MTITIRFNYYCTLALPIDMKATEVAMLFELLSRCNKIESLYADKAKENIEFFEGVELAIKRGPTVYPTRAAAENLVRERNVAALASVALAEAAQV
jgi:hypothetical protein